MELNLQRPVLFFDIESTGLNIGTDCICELSFVKALPGGEDLARSLEWLLTTENVDALAEDKYFCMEGIASETIEKLQAQGLTEAACGDLEKHAYSVNDGIRDSEIRNLNVMVCV